MTLEKFFENTHVAAFDMGGLVKDETAAFIYHDEEKQLLFDIESVVSVKSSDGKTVYKQGVDYVLRNGKLALTENTSIPVMTPEIYYSDGEEPYLKVLKPDGTESPCYFNASGTMGRHQVCVTYRTNNKSRILPVCNGRFERFLRLLESGEDATVLFYGDSITYGANASLVHNLPPYSPPYTIMFVCALAEIYGYCVKFALPEAENTYCGPFPEPPAGKRGTITFVNTAVGGWNSEDGIVNLGTHITPQVKKHGCDLFVLAYGMNDGGRSPCETAANCEKIARHVLSISKTASVMLVSTMLPNPDALHGWYANQPFQETELEKLAKKLNGEGTPCDAAKMTSVSAKILERKKFIDISGNNINHPNDYFSRVYAAVLLQTLAGYDSEIPILNN
ncbi:MAG: SGNH/GDSL hydrolase family protein [Clostridia bacterium]|nr:SGNH/GDSL hydrolase family protein [Clostridia bacterium]